MKNHPEIVDYAQHLMKIEKYTRECSELSIDRKYSAAILVLPEIIAQARMLQATLAIMEAEEDRKVKK